MYLIQLSLGQLCLLTAAATAEDGPTLYDPSTLLAQANLFTASLAEPCLLGTGTSQMLKAKAGVTLPAPLSQEQHSLQQALCGVRFGSRKHLQQICTVDVLHSSSDLACATSDSPAHAAALTNPSDDDTMPVGIRC